MSTISPQYSGRAEIADQYKASQAEKEEIKKTNETEIENLKKAYTAQKAGMEDRFEQSLQADRLSHYDHLRNTKNQMTREESQLQHAHNEYLNKKQTEDTREENRIEVEGRTKINEALRKYAAAEEYERNRTARAEAEVKTAHHKSAEAIISDSQKKLDNLAEEKWNYLEGKKAEHAVALNQIENHYNGIRAQNHQQYQGEIAKIQETAENDLNQRKLANATLLNEHASKQTDPFYQLKKFDSMLTDAGDAYILRVKIPEYERGHFKLQVSGQEMRLSGVRSSDEEAVIEPGRSVATRSYQNISEHFNLDRPVDGRAVSFVENGDWLTYTIPKFTANHRVSDQYRRPVNMSDDTDPTKELSFKDTLPTASNVNRNPAKS